MKKLRGKFGYVFKSRFAQVGKLQSNYYIQIGFLGSFWGQWYTLYCSPSKPKIRHLGLISLLAPFYGIWQGLVVAYFVLVGLGIGLPLKITGGLLVALAQCLIFNSREAKEEIKRLF